MKNRRKPFRVATIERLQVNNLLNPPNPVKHHRVLFEERGN